MSSHPEAHDILSNAAEHMYERASTYDSPNGERSMEKTVSMFNTLLGGDRLLTTEQGWLFMAILKIVRCQQGHFRLDNYEDLAAYAALAAETASQERDYGLAPGTVTPVQEYGETVGEVRIRPRTP